MFRWLSARSSVSVLRWDLEEGLLQRDEGEARPLEHVGVRRLGGELRLEARAPPGVTPARHERSSLRHMLFGTPKCTVPHLSSA